MSLLIWTAAVLFTSVLAAAIVALIMKTSQKPRAKAAGLAAPPQDAPPPAAPASAPPPGSPSGRSGILGRKGPGSGRGVSFIEPQAPGLENKLLLPVMTLEGHASSVESAAFSEDGLLATGGGPDDMTVRIYARGVGSVGALRHVLAIERDTPRPDGAGIVGFALDAGARTTVLLVGTRSERYLLGYRVSKAANTLPQRVFAFPTTHGGPISGMAGFIGLDTVNFNADSTDMYFCTCAKGTREVKFWSIKGTLLCVYDAQCWTAGVKISADGKRVAVLASGGGQGCVLGVHMDKKGVKVQRLGSIPTLLSKLGAAPSDSAGGGTNGGSSSPSGPSSSSSKRPSILMGDAVYQAAQDVLFNENGSLQAVVARANGGLTYGQLSAQECEWRLELDAPQHQQPLGPVLFTHAAALIEPDVERLTRSIVARGKSAVFYDKNGGVLASIESAEGDVLQVVPNRKFEIVVVVSFGGKMARVFRVP